MPTLELVRAGAGAGKTYDLCETVAAAVSKGVDPAKILGTTFTNKAAAELKGRIQERLLANTENPAEARRSADRLELAAIGTVHSVAHQLLSRYAIEMGLSPRLEVVTEAAQNRALAELLGGYSAASGELARLADRLGIRDVADRILSLLDSKRGNLIDDADFRDQLAASADRVCELLAPGGPDAGEGNANQLAELAEAALDELVLLTSDVTAVTEKARGKLRLLDSPGISHWGRYLEAARIKAGKRSGADALLDPLRNHATRVRQNPLLHEDVRGFVRLLATATIEVGEAYTDYKIVRGLVDFTDLETLLLSLLQQEQLAARLAEDFELVLVDEFQDTNPLQLGIFQQLRKLAKRSRWVGDPKQAIYGFRDTDPELVSGVWNSLPEDWRETLDSNYRSQSGLVKFVGRLFSPVFGQDAVQLPKHPPEAEGIERWLIAAKNNPDEKSALACGIVELQQRGTPFGDMVVLERTNAQLRQLGTALEELGVPILLESPGLLSTREGAMVLAGLRLVADRDDALAAATVLHLQVDPEQETPDWIVERLQAVREQREAREAAVASAECAANSANGTESNAAEPLQCPAPWEGDPRFLSLEMINRNVLSPAAVVRQVIEALGLPVLIQRWGSTAARSSSLDSLLRHAEEYEEQAITGGQPATLSGFILWLEELRKQNLDVRYPPVGHDAVTLMTYHSAKGLEWPVVILSSLGSQRDADVWRPVVTGGEDDNPLKGRVVRAWTWPFGRTEGEFSRRRTGSELEQDALASAEGQMLTQRQLQENLRLLYVGCTRAKRKLVFAHRVNNYGWLQNLSAVDEILNPDWEAGTYELPELGTSCVIRSLEPGMVESCQVAAVTTERWLELPPSSDEHPTERRFFSPSTISEADSEPVAEALIEGDQDVQNSSFVKQDLSGESFTHDGANRDEAAAIGDAVHSYLAALPSLTECNLETRTATAERCLAAFGVTGLLPADVLVAAGTRFEQWVRGTWPEAIWHVEISACGTRSAGGTWNGILDLVLELADGSVVVIDHKSAAISRDKCTAKAARYLEQLAAYQDVLTAAGHRVESLWIHFPLAGCMVQHIEKRPE